MGREAEWERRACRRIQQSHSSAASVVALALIDNDPQRGVVGDIPQRLNAAAPAVRAVDRAAWERDIFDEAVIRTQSRVKAKGETIGYQWNVGAEARTEHVEIAGRAFEPETLREVGL